MRIPRPGRWPVASASLRLLGLFAVIGLTSPAEAEPMRRAAGARGPKAAGRAAQAARPTPRPAKAAGRHGKRTKAADKTPAAGKKKGRAGGGSTWIFHKPANVVPNQQGKVVLFNFRNDDREMVTIQVGQLLESRGLEVMTGVRPVDSAEQYRDLATALDLVAFVDGDVQGGATRTKVTVRLRSGHSGRKVSQAVFSESRQALAGEISSNLWSKLGGAVARACADVANKPRKASRTTLRINAGTPLD